MELCQACILSEEDVLSKVYHIVEIDHIRNQFRDNSIKQREEIIGELSERWRISIRNKDVLCLACIQSKYPNVSASVKTRIEHRIIYSSHELILIQGIIISRYLCLFSCLGQLQNTISSLIYTGPCFIQIQFGQCGLKPFVRITKFINKFLLL